MKVAIAAGGTAGHVNPAVSTARALRDAEVVFIGRPASLEQRLVTAAGFPFRELSVRGFDRGKISAAPATFGRATAALLAAVRLLKGERPEVVLGMGGFVSLPVCWAARKLRMPVVLHEQNIVFGLANKLSKPVATAVAVSFEETLGSAGRRGVFTGNPISPEMAAFDRGALRSEALREFGLHEKRKTVLVFGGSQGAERLNAVATGLIEHLRDRSDLQILHITGAREEAGGRDRAAPHEVSYRAMQFVDKMPLAYAAADMAVVRGGATTVAELCAAALPAVIVPYPHHRDRQQERHAAVLVRAGAAVCLPDADATPQTVAGILRSWADDPEELDEKSRAAARLARPDAAERLAEVVMQAGAGAVRTGAR